MKKFHISFLIIIALFLGKNGTAQTRVVPAPAQDTPILLQGATIHTGTGDVIENGIVAFADGKITAVGPAGTSVTDQGNYEVMDVSGKHIYPGLVLTSSDLGLVEVSSVRATADFAEQGDINPNVRSIVAYNTDSELIPTFRFNGILLAQTAPRSGVISGSSSVVQLDAWNWEDAAYHTDDAIHMGWPNKEFSPRWWMGETNSRPNPNYDKTVSEVDQLFTDAAAYGRIGNPDIINLKLKAMQGLFDGSKALFIGTNDAKAIISAVKMARKHGVQRIVVDGGYEALLIKDFLVENKIPVILSDIHGLPSYDHEDTIFPYKMAKEFSDAGIEIIISGGAGYAARNMPFYAGTAVAYGLDYEEAIKAMTLNPAKALGIADRAGSLETGKDAMILIVEGDLLDMRTSKVEQAYIQGRKIQMDARQQWLYKKYSDKYGHDTGEGGR
ncbi:amidohydrolase family protein [Flavilitoribacter nigricans]|uniref:Amidohydrolase n=1 Tax=Flavilitoribacter nigricans (strain ATCC 23147 / DSM 23189 / NBRC 102662 / NCIMB 1420 / SS-2) TaxID=1122177 RepID=A0A2D0N273_FLAN2|nr:amidohydrolase family protein [Flavilitoribacter nigricans]PHN02604.1 amidohydrolase [Flavilitoribacter nigricans DSM 23189 = NBRC 102662]